MINSFLIKLLVTIIIKLIKYSLNLKSKYSKYKDTTLYLN